VQEIRSGRMLIVVDDEDRENEGDLTVAADKVTPEIINFMATHGRGLICLSMTGERLDQLDLPLMVANNTSNFETAFTTSIDSKHGVTTGISAHDRARTILAAIDPETKPYDLSRPGHIFPLRAKPGGVLKRAGQTEAGVDLANMAGLYPAAVICEIMNEDGTMSRLQDLEKFAGKHKLKIACIKDLIAYRMRTEKMVKLESKVSLPTHYGDFQAYCFSNQLDNLVHVGLVKGEITPDSEVLVRVHSECLTGDALGSSRCDCGNQLHTAMEMIGKADNGVLLYMRQEGRGIGFLNKMKSYALQDQGKDTVDANLSLGFKADLRDYGIGAQILGELGCRHIRLITNNPRKIVGLDGYGIQIAERIPLLTETTESNVRYLKVKKKRLGHLLK
ncbi:MAG: bifunctional 3,4-dihydroxy-2-butanone-4-phosphate synthase/GTP cyclohydrolase II, partial [bacterium]